MMFGLWLVAFLAAAWRFRPTSATDPGIRLLWWSAVPVWGVFALASFVKAGSGELARSGVRRGLRPGGGVGARATAGRPQPARRLVPRGECRPGAARGCRRPFPRAVPPILARIVGPPTRPRPHSHPAARHHRAASRVEHARGRGRSVARADNRGNRREPVLAGTYWTIPGHLASTCRGHPDVYSIGIPNRTDRHSQYDFWRPNPVADAQVFRGRTFVIVGQIGPELVAAFDRVEAPVRVIHAENGIPMEAWTVWVCHGFRGFDHMPAHEPGLLTTTLTDGVCIQDGARWAARRTGSWRVRPAACGGTARGACRTTNGRRSNRGRAPAAGRTRSPAAKPGRARPCGHAFAAAA